MQKHYRSEYPGEFVITNTVFKNGRKEQEREWIENPIQNTSTSERACCISPGAITARIPLVRIEKHQGGVLGRDRMQLYGVEEIWDHITTDFLTVLNQERLDEIMDSGYQVDRVVYTTARLCTNNPGEFYLIPHGVAMVPPATALWLACFDGHKDIYMYGYNQSSDETKTIAAIKSVMQTYSDVNFHHVTECGSHDSWRRCINFEMISEREFISQCDI